MRQAVCCAALLLAGIQVVTGRPAAVQGAAFRPVTDAVLRDQPAGDWLRWRRDHGATAHSPLNQITRDNVGHLRLAWAWAMQDGVQEQEPVVHDGIMYLPHADGTLQALDGATGTMMWERRRQLPKDAGRGDTVRNIALYQDKVFQGTQDGHLVALEAATGKVVWDVEVGDYQDRVNYSAGPIAADGRVFSALTCGVGTKRACFVSAHDAATGKQLWRRESVAGPGDPEAHQATWGGVPYERRLKSSFWLTGSYDSTSKTLYWTTGSAYPYPEILKGTGDGALLYTNSMLALDGDTGAIKWFFQMQPRDNFDMDHQDNPILADVPVGETIRRMVFALGKPGVLWAFDRDTGRHLWNTLLVAEQNLYRHIDPETGAVAMNTDIIPTQVGASQIVCPGMRGGKLFQTHAYSPRTHALYSPVSNACTTFEVVPLGVNASGVKYERLSHMKGTGDKVGRLAAVSAATGKILWTYDQRAAMGSVMTTGGGLVFAGDFYRYFRAFDDTTGEVLWEIPLSAPVTGYPISYAADGRQYIAINVGGGTSGQRHLNRLYPELRVPNGSNVLMVFALDPDEVERK